MAAAGCALRRSLLDTPLKTPCDGGQCHAWSGPSPGRFWGGRMVIAIITCYILSCLPGWTWNCQLFGCGSLGPLGYWHDDTEGEGLQCLDREEQSWDICGGRGDAHWCWIRWCWIRILRQSQRSQEQKTNDDMGRIFWTLLNYISCPYKSSCFFWLSTLMNQVHDAAVQGVSQLWGFFLETKAHLLLNTQQIITCNYTVCSYMQLPASKPSSMFLKL